MYCTQMCVYIYSLQWTCMSACACACACVYVCVCVRMIVHMCIWFICVVVSYSPMNVHTDSIASYDSYLNTQQGGLLLPLSRSYWNHTEPFVSENKMRPKSIRWKLISWKRSSVSAAQVHRRLVMVRMLSSSWQNGTNSRPMTTRPSIIEGTPMPPRESSVAMLASRFKCFNSREWMFICRTAFWFELGKWSEHFGIWFGEESACQAKLVLVQGDAGVLQILYAWGNLLRQLCWVIALLGSLGPWE